MKTQYAPEPLSGYTFKQSRAVTRWWYAMKDGVQHWVSGDGKTYRGEDALDFVECELPPEVVARLKELEER